MDEPNRELALRVLLVNPEYPISETPSPPLSLAVLAAHLEAAGVEVEVLDLAVTPCRPIDLERLLERFSPRVVGVTCVTMTFFAAVRIVRAVKRLSAGVFTVMGGPHVSFCARQALRKVPELDFVCRGEGERPLLALCRAIGENDDLSAIPGLVRRGPGGLVENRLSLVPEDPDAAPPPARHLLPLGRYLALGLPVSMITSRGCPFRCIFCAGRKMGDGRVRYRDPHRVVAEMAYLARIGFHQINIADDLFTSRQAHCLGVCRQISQQGLSLAWTCFSRVDTVSAKIVSALAEAGCHTVSFGVESADPDILRTVRKGITPDQVLSAVSLCVDAGITPQISFILGLPGETPQSLEKTTAFARRLQQMGATYGFHLLAPFPGTEVRRRAAAYGLKILTDDWSLYSANRAVAETETVSAAMLDEIVMRWEKKFDQYLERLRKLRENGGASSATTWPLTRLEHTVVLYDLMMSRTIEEQGTWRNGQGPVAPKTALKVLIDRIPLPAGANYDRGQLEKSLRFAVAEGHLAVADDAGKIRWRWVETVPLSL